MDVRITQADLNALATLLTTKPPDAGIDTSALVTMLGFAAAVWTVVPNTVKLRLRLCLSTLDWSIVALAILAIHYLFLEEFLRNVGLFWVAGPWSWGFDKAIAQYMLFLVPLLWILARSFKTRVTLRNLPLLQELTVELLRARKFEELAILLDDHLATVLEIANGQTNRGRLEAWVRPTVTWNPPVMLANGAFAPAIEGEPGAARRAQLAARRWLADRIAPSEARQTAQAIARTLLSSHELATYLALARPYLCKDVMAQATLLVEEFQDEVFAGLLASESSVFYAELKNNVNLTRVGHRYRLPDENKLLCYYLADVKVAGDAGVFRSLGEAVLSRIDSDDFLRQRLNGPLLRYQERDKYRCPVHAGVQFFDVMILEGLHQRSDDHLWLHYYRHFIEHLLKRARALESDDETHAHPSPLSYLLYVLISTAAKWVAEAAVITKRGDTLSNEGIDGNHVYISFEATEVLGAMVQSVLLSKKVSDRQKVELLETPLYTLKELEKHQQLEPLAQSLAVNLARPYGIVQSDYTAKVRDYLLRVDGELRAHSGRFERMLSERQVGE